MSRLCRATSTNCCRQASSPDAAMAPRAQIILPGLFDLPADELDADFLRQGLPRLNHFLRFSSPRVNRCHTLDDLVGDALFVEHEPGSSLPLARTCAGDEGFDGARALLFEAAHLHADLNAALLLPLNRDQRNFDDINIIINDLSELFKVDCDISEVAEGTYLLILKDFSAPTHYPHPLSILGKATNVYTEQTRANLPWYRLLNEMQMFLYQHPRNVERVREGLLTINSLWCWGGGDGEMSHRSARWFCDDALLGRLPQQRGLEIFPLRDFDRQLPRADWVYLDLTLLETLKGLRDEKLESFLETLDRTVMAPALDWTRRHGGSVTLRVAASEDLVLRARDRFRFWRPRRSLVDLLDHP